MTVNNTHKRRNRNMRVDSLMEEPLCLLFFFFLDHYKWLCFINEATSGEESTSSVNCESRSNCTVQPGMFLVSLLGGRWRGPMLMKRPLLGWAGQAITTSQWDATWVRSSRLVKQPTGQVELAKFLFLLIIEHLRIITQNVNEINST